MASYTEAQEPKGIIGQATEGGKPVIYKFVNEMPATEVRSQLTWLTVISWKYDGSSNNGMPMGDENQAMINLEKAIEGIETKDNFRHVYSRTGNDLKELVYYIHGQEEFMAEFNKALSNHPRYPIEINFYRDDGWEDFQRLLGDFSNAANQQMHTDQPSAGR